MLLLPVPVVNQNSLRFYGTLNNFSDKGSDSR